MPFGAPRKITRRKSRDSNNNKRRTQKVARLSLPLRYNLMNIPFKVRTATFDDYDAWHLLWMAYLDFYKIALPVGLDEITWQRLIDDQSQQHCLLCENPQGQVVGFAIFVFHRSSWAQTWNCLIEDVFVCATQRAQGIGRLLFEGVFAIAERQACYRTYWQTDRNNTTARKLYDQLGQVAEVVQYRRSDGNGADTGLTEMSSIGQQ
jgi:GNAT superfamily N-acetyltransferase